MISHWKDSAPFAVVGAFFVALVAGDWGFVAHTNRLIDQHDAVWDGAAVVKICRDGTRIYRLKDGRFMAGGFGATEVAAVSTVCD